MDKQLYYFTKRTVKCRLLWKDVRLPIKWIVLNKCRHTYGYKFVMHTIYDDYLLPQENSECQLLGNSSRVLLPLWLTCDLSSGNWLAILVKGCWTKQAIGFIQRSYEKKLCQKPERGDNTNWRKIQIHYESLRDFKEQASYQRAKFNFLNINYKQWGNEDWKSSERHCSNKSSTFTFSLLAGYNIY